MIPGAGSFCSGEYVFESFEVRTRERTQFVDITESIERVVTKSQIEQGMCLVFVPHTTAAVTINENADPDVVRDMQAELSRMVPADGRYRHTEGNSDAHIKASILGCSELLLVRKGGLVLGTWQGIYFAEFDGPRRRQVQVQVMGNQ